MDEYISRENVLDNRNIITVQTKEYGSIEVIPVDTITDIELADVQPVRHGRWKLTDNPSFKKCSECDAWWSSVFTDSCLIKYCPNCGTRIIKDGDANG